MMLATEPMDVKTLLSYDTTRKLLYDMAYDELEELYEEHGLELDYEQIDDKMIIDYYDMFAFPPRVFELDKWPDELINSLRERGFEIY